MNDKFLGIDIGLEKLTKSFFSWASNEFVGDLVALALFFYVEFIGEAV